MPTATAVPEPVVLAPGESRSQKLNSSGAEIFPKVLGQDNGGNFFAGVGMIPPMAGPPMHMHTREDEWFYILKGELTFEIGGKRIVAGPGTSVFAPREVPHAFRNFTNEMVETLCVVTPSGFEEFFSEVSRIPQEPVHFEQLMNKYGVIAMGPPLER